MALVTVNDDDTWDGRPKPRWPAAKRLDVVLRLLRSENELSVITYPSHRPERRYRAAERF